MTDLPSVDIFFKHTHFAKCGRMLNQPADVLEAVRINCADDDLRKKGGVESFWVTVPGESLPFLGTAPEGWARGDDHYSNP